jgi:hypothetical protein
VVCQGTPQANALKEVLDERDTGELGQADSVGSNLQILGAAVHCSKTTLLVGFSRNCQNTLPSRC